MNRLINYQFSIPLSHSLGIYSRQPSSSSLVPFYLDHIVRYFVYTFIPLTRARASLKHRSKQTSDLRLDGEKLSKKRNDRETDNNTEWKCCALIILLLHLVTQRVGLCGRAKKVVVVVVI